MCIRDRYTIVTILISWLSLTLFAGGILIRQVFDIPMWQSALILLVISAFFTMAGGLKAVAYTNAVSYTHLAGAGISAWGFTPFWKCSHIFSMIPL